MKTILIFKLFIDYNKEYFMALCIMCVLRVKKKEIQTGTVNNAAFNQE